MNPQLDKTANLNLPPPIAEATLPMPEATAPEVQAHPEQLPSPPPAASTTPLPPPPPPTNSPPTPVAAAATTDDAASTTTPARADDNDLIEKEWVAKAKEIINRTHEDPYSQNKQISLVKADYMKKRYNKDIKLPE